MLEVLGEGEIVHLVFKVRKPGLIPALIIPSSTKYQQKQMFIANNEPLTPIIPNPRATETATTNK
jgi:hypothetical protein